MNEINAPEGKRHEFFIALYQFLSPVVGVRENSQPYRLPGQILLSIVNDEIYHDLDTSSNLSHSSGSSIASSIYKDIGPVPRRHQQKTGAIPPPPTFPSVTVKQPPKPSSGRSIRTLSTPESSTNIRKRKRSEKSKQWDELKKNSEFFSYVLCIEKFV
jgi:hypothetical protein